MHLCLQMEMQGIHSHLKAAASSQLWTRTMINGKITARRNSRVVGGMASAIKRVLMVSTSMEATQTPPIMPRESRGTVGQATNTF